MRRFLQQQIELRLRRRAAQKLFAARFCLRR